MAGIFWVGSRQESRRVGRFVQVDFSIVSAIGGLGVGATVGALIAHLLRERVEQERRKWEKEGLIRLLHVEMTGNSSTIAMSRHKDELLYVNVTEDTWNTTRGRIAALLAEKRELNEDFDKIVLYYSFLRVFMDKLREYRRLAEEEARVKASEEAALSKAAEEEAINEAVEKRIRAQKAAEAVEKRARIEKATEPKAILERLKEMKKDRSDKKTEKEIRAEEEARFRRIRYQVELSLSRAGASDSEEIEGHCESAYNDALEWADAVEDRFQQALPILLKHMHSGNYPEAPQP